MFDRSVRGQVKDEKRNDWSTSHFERAVRLRIRQLSISRGLREMIPGPIEAIFDMMKLKQEQITK